MSEGFQAEGPPGGAPVIQLDDVRARIGDDNWVPFGPEGSALRAKTEAIHSGLAFHAAYVTKEQNATSVFSELDVLPNTVLGKVITADRGSFRASPLDRVPQAVGREHPAGRPSQRAKFLQQFAAAQTQSKSSDRGFDN